MKRKHETDALVELVGNFTEATVSSFKGQTVPWNKDSVGNFVKEEAVKLIKLVLDGLEALKVMLRGALNK